MFDRSLLAPADLEFVVMTDTHYMLDPGGQRVEFESRRRQSARAAHAIDLVAALESAFVVHLGDLVQEFPESPGFVESLGQALAQFEAAGVQTRQVAGNHDVGDKPDPTMPTDWATDETVRAYHKRFGSSWTSWNEGGCHFIILNSQIVNGQLAAVDEQARWLEADLAAHRGEPTFVFLHLSPFLVSEREPGLGHYDNIDEPARSWLLDLLRQHQVQMVFAGHSHFAFFNRVGSTRMYVVPSVAFTRPGFCEVFSSPPPPERGRDDVGKLGLFLVRVRDGAATVHLIRTGGATTRPDPGADARRVLTRPTRDMPASPLGVTLRHALAPATDVPIAWQSTVRQPVRNDYPLLACLELGVRHLRVPAQDLTNPAQRERLRLLRDEGVAITVMSIWSERSGILTEAAEHRDYLDGVELQLPSALLPDDACLKAISRMRDELGLSVSIAPLLPREVAPGKQHPRTRIGYHVAETTDLDRHLAANGVRVERVLARVDPGQSPWDAIAAVTAIEPPQQFGAIDWAVEFADDPAADQTARAAEALLAIAAQPGARLYLEPLVDFDRTMDTPPGLLDRLCNPRPVFHAVRTLNSILFRRAGGWQPVSAPVPAGSTNQALCRDGESLMLILPRRSGESPPIRLDLADWPADRTGEVTLYDLEAAMSRTAGRDDVRTMEVAGPTLLRVTEAPVAEAAEARSRVLTP